MGRRGRAGQGVGPSLSDPPYHDYGLNHDGGTMGHGKGVQVGMGWLMPWLGATTPSDGKGHVWTRFLTVGGERGRDGRVWGPSCSPSLGIALKMLPRKGWTVGHCSSPPWWHYYENATEKIIPVEGEGCGATALVLPGGRY